MSDFYIDDVFDRIGTIASNCCYSTEDVGSALQNLSTTLTAYNSCDEIATAVKNLDCSTSISCNRIDALEDGVCSFSARLDEMGKSVKKMNKALSELEVALGLGKKCRITPGRIDRSQFLTLQKGHLV